MTISRSSGAVSILTNGLPYFFVEVTWEDGSHYGIPAYGEEAIELHKEAVRVSIPEIITICYRTLR